MRGRHQHPDLRCWICDAQLERPYLGSSWLCMHEDCRQGVTNLARIEGLDRDVALQQFRRNRRRRRRLQPARLGDEEAREACADAARAWGQRASARGQGHHDAIEEALRGANLDEATFENAKDWLDIVTVGAKDETESVSTTLWRAYSFGEKLPCPLQAGSTKCSYGCQACYGTGELYEDCDHCTPYIEIIPAALADAV